MIGRTLMARKVRPAFPKTWIFPIGRTRPLQCLRTGTRKFPLGPEGRKYPHKTGRIYVCNFFFTPAGVLLCDAIRERSSVALANGNIRIAFRRISPETQNRSLMRRLEPEEVKENGVL